MLRDKTILLTLTVGEVPTQNCVLGQRAVATLRPRTTRKFAQPSSEKSCDADLHKLRPLPTRGPEFVERVWKDVQRENPHQTTHVYLFFFFKSYWSRARGRDLYILESV